MKVQHTRKGSLLYHIISLMVEVPWTKYQHLVLLLVSTLVIDSTVYSRHWWSTTAAAWFTHSPTRAVFSQVDLNPTTNNDSTIGKCNGSSSA